MAERNRTNLAQLVGLTWGWIRSMQGTSTDRNYILEALVAVESELRKVVRLPAGPGVLRHIERWSDRRSLPDILLNMAAEREKQVIHRAAEGLLKGPQHTDLYVERGLSFVRPDTRPLNTGSGSGDFKAPVFQPRLEWLLEWLAEKGYRLDSLLIHQGKDKAGTFRKRPYNLVEIVPLGIQIAVCDQVGEVTLIACPKLTPYEWATYTKDQLRALGMLKVVCCDKGQWLAGIGAALTGRQPVMAPEAVASYRRKARTEVVPLSDEFVFAKAMEEMCACPEGKERWPKVGNSQTVIGLPEENWNAWHQAKRTACRGFTEKGKGVAEIFRQQVARRAKTFEGKHGFLPGEDEGGESLKQEVDPEHFPGVTWEKIRRAFANYQHPFSLEWIWVEQGLRQSDAPLKFDLSRELIAREGFQWLRREGTFPTDRSGAIPGYMGQEWSAWDKAARTGIRGMDGGKSVFSIMNNAIVVKAREHIVRTRRCDFPDEAPFGDHEGVTWGLIRKGLANRGPVHSCTLEQFLKEYSVLARLSPIHINLLKPAP